MIIRSCAGKGQEQWPPENAVLYPFYSVNHWPWVENNLLLSNITIEYMQRGHLCWYLPVFVLLFISVIVLEREINYSLSPYPEILFILQTPESATQAVSDYQWKPQTGIQAA